MIPLFGWLRSLIERWRETQLIKESNARKEAQLKAAIQSPSCTPELMEAATVYFMHGTTRSVRVKEEQK